MSSLHQRHLSYFTSTWTDETPVDEVRFILLDSETTGLDPRKDRLITIGAVSVIAGDILLEDGYESMLKIQYNSSAVTVHGVTREESQAGIEEPQALEEFMDYLRDGIIVGHHIKHDVDTFDVGYERHWGFQMSNRSLDTMALALRLEADGAFAGQDPFRSFSLDELCDRFGVIPHDRHTAPGDAFMTALVFQRLLRYAKHAGRITLGQLCEPPPEP
ncbi:MAG: 3'-5' exonuclease [Bryobacteraceae bacterium]